MLLALLAVSGAPFLYTITATDASGADHRFATVEYQEKSNLAKITPTYEHPFDSGLLKTFKIVRKDGSLVKVPAPKVTKSLAFKVSLIGETPVALDVVTAYRREGLQVSLNRAKSMPQPAYQTQEAASEPSGIMGLLSKFWYVPLIFIVMNMIKGGGGAAAAQAPAQ